MKALIKRFWQEDDALGTVEMVLLMAALVAVALVFKTKIVEWVTTALGDVFGNASKGTANN